MRSDTAPRISAAEPSEDIADCVELCRIDERHPRTIKRADQAVRDLGFCRHPLGTHGQHFFDAA
jgi:hypothetical protein